MAVLESEHKFQVLGFVEFVFNLSNSAKDLILNNDMTWAYGVVVSMFDFYCGDQGLNPGHVRKIS